MPLSQQPIVPPPSTPLLREDGQLSREWRRYFEDMQRWLNDLQTLAVMLREES